jgi:hypothetical protein
MCFAPTLCAEIPYEGASRPASALTTCDFICGFTIGWLFIVASLSPCDTGIGKKLALFEI